MGQLRRQLDYIFNPKSVAIIGASANPDKFGYQITGLLKEEGYRGGIYPINPHATEIKGLECFKSINQLPEIPDVAVISLPAKQVIEAVRDCVKLGVQGVVVISSGFAEAGEMGTLFQNELKSVIATGNTRVIGPNCEGFVNTASSLLLSFSIMFKCLKKGPISIVSQSGSYCGVLARRIHKSGVGLAKIISSGNEVDLAAIDYFDYLADDPDTAVILAYLEEIRKPMEFKERIGKITHKKPVIIQKAGRTKIGRKAVVSHTGALAGSDDVISALFKQAGVIRVKSISELIDAAIGMAAYPLVTGNRLAILSSAGGLAVELAELCVDAGLSVPSLTDHTRQELSKILPHFAAINNPVDMTGNVVNDPEAMGKTLEVVLQDPNIDATLLILTIARSGDFARVVHRTMGRHQKPVLMCWTAGFEMTPEPISYLIEQGIPFFDSPERLRNAISALVFYSKFRLGDRFLLAKERIFHE